MFFIQNKILIKNIRPGSSLKYLNFVTFIFPNGPITVLYCVDQSPEFVKLEYSYESPEELVK